MRLPKACQLLPPCSTQPHSTHAHSTHVHSTHAHRSIDTPQGLAWPGRSWNCSGGSRHSLNCGTHSNEGSPLYSDSWGMDRMASLYNCSHAKSLGNLGIQNSRYFLRGFTYNIQSRSIWQKRLFKRNILGGLSSIETVPARGQYYLVMIPDSDLNVNIAVLCNNVSRKHTNCSYSRVTMFSHLRIHKLCRKILCQLIQDQILVPTLIAILKPYQHPD